MLSWLQAVDIIDELMFGKNKVRENDEVMKFMGYKSGHTASGHSIIYGSG